jgi:cytochrome P450
MAAHLEVSTGAGRAAHAPPATGLGDLARLAGAIAGNFARSPRSFSARVAFREWARRMMARHGSENLVLNLGVKKLLLVGGRDLSRQLLQPPPLTRGIAAGKLKCDAMAFLAPHALTISHDAEWTRLRAFTERVLQPGRPHEFRQAFHAEVHHAFAAPPATVEEIRRAMGRAMLGIVFGHGVAGERLDRDVQALFDVVQQPAKRLLLGRWERRRRDRFYDELRRLWEETAALRGPSLLTLAHREADAIPEAELVEQIPHWMFTFTGSGTDLLVRTLALVTSDDGVADRARREIDAAGPPDRAETIDALTYLEACVMESARLYPPVTRTFHRVQAGAVVGDVRIPAGMEILHSFPLLGRAEASEADAERFRPERWLPSPASAAADFDPFLSGSRHCPGRELIVFVCKSALALLLVRHRLVVSAPLRGDALPPAFPERGIRFTQS